MKRRKWPSTYKVLDAEDYRDIATIDVERELYDLAIDDNDSYLAVSASLT